MKDQCIVLFLLLSIVKKSSIFLISSNYLKSIKFHHVHSRRNSSIPPFYISYLLIKQLRQLASYIQFEKKNHRECHLDRNEFRPIGSGHRSDYAESVERVTLSVGARDTGRWIRGIAWRDEGRAGEVNRPSVEVDLGGWTR